MELLFPVLVTLSITLALGFYSLIRTLKSLKYTYIKSPPQAAGAWPLVGHLSLFSGPELPHITLSNMADRYGPIFSIRLGVHRALIISSHEIAKESFSSHTDIVFSNRPQTVAIQHMSYEFAMFGFSQYGPYWRELRKISMMMLSNKKVAMYGELIEKEVTAAIKTLYKSCVDGDGARNNRIPLEMKEWFGDLNLKLIVRIVAGEELKKGMEMGGSGEKWKKAIQQFFKMMNVVTISDVIPIMKWVHCFVGAGKIKEFKKTGKDMDSMLQTWLHFHKNNYNEFGKEKESFMRQMLDYAETVAQEFPSYEADTVNKATCKAMILGGTDTTTVALTWALSLLLNNPHTLKRAQDELDINIGRGRHVTRSDIKNLAYIKAIVKETLRLYPVVPLLPARIAGEDCRLAGYPVRAGTWLMINAWKLQRDPCVWNNALEFVPERFLTDHREVDVKGQHFELLPFGSGRRICPGISLSLHVLELVLASLLHGFDIKTQSDGPVDMSGSPGSTYTKATPLQVFLTPRLSSNHYL